METKHTPTPWKRVDAKIYGADNEPVARAWHDRNPIERDANAGFIVRACNSHEALVALADRISHLNPDAGEIGEGMLHRIVSEAEAALKLAKP